MLLQVCSLVASLSIDMRTFGAPSRAPWQQLRADKDSWKRYQFITLVNISQNCQMTGHQSLSHAYGDKLKERCEWRQPKSLFT